MAILSQRKVGVAAGFARRTATQLGRLRGLYLGLWFASGGPSCCAARHIVQDRV